MTDPQNEDTAFLADAERAFEAVVAELREKLQNSPPVIRKYTEQLLLSQGKYVRARCVLAASALDDGAIPLAAVRLACAVELVHLASLVHDDVIDDASVRRGSPTLQKTFGKKKAVICGDWLLCLALSTAASVYSSRKPPENSLISYASRLCLGELTQQEHNGDFNLSYYRYLFIISGKTAALFEAAFFCGASLTHEDKKQIKAVAKFGRYFGLIFQLLDDCIDYEQEESDAGKPVRSDFAQGVVTLPLIYALNTDPALKSEISHFSAADVVNLVKKAGGVLFTKKVARSYRRKAFAALETCAFTEEKKVRFIKLLDFLSNEL